MSICSTKKVYLPHPSARMWNRDWLESANKTLLGFNESIPVVTQPSDPVAGKARERWGG
jgi:hypothetical protein